MNKKIFIMTIVSLALCTNVSAFGLKTLGLGGGSEEAGEEQKVPVSDRIQTVDYNLVGEISEASDKADYKYVKEFKRFAAPASCLEALKNAGPIPGDCVKPGRKVSESKLGDLKINDEELYSLISTIVSSAAEEFQIRTVPDEVKKDSFGFLTKTGIDNLVVLQISTAADEKVTSARYFPEGKISLLGVKNEKLSDPAYRAEVGFMVAHEMGHALGMHVLEDKTAGMNVKGRITDAADISVDVAIEKVYSQMSTASAQTVNSAAKMLAGIFLQPGDLNADIEVMEGRNKSSAVRMAKQFGQSDKLLLLGADLKTPTQTRVVMKKMMLSGMESAQILEALNNGTDATAYMLNAVSHSKDQEFEADQIGFYLAQEAKLDSQEILSFLNAKAAKEKGSSSIIGGHPSMNDRIARIKEEYEL